MSEEKNSTTLKKKLLEALHVGLTGEGIQASVMAQAINYLKAFPAEEEPGAPGELSPALARFAEKQSFTHTALTKQ